MACHPLLMLKRALLATADDGGLDLLCDSSTLYCLKPSKILSLVPSET